MRHTRERDILLEILVDELRPVIEDDARTSLRKPFPADQSLEDFEALLPGSVQLEKSTPDDLSGEDCT